MDMRESKNKDKVYIKVSLSEKEKECIVERASSQKISMNKFLKTKIMDTDKGINELKDEISRRMPQYYDLLQQVDDKGVKMALMEWGGQLWQSLK